ncbi:hypothetical protein NAL32_14000 [Chryseobacterium sp. Ch-15]|uniref:Uncharacterized protein n=1 Tax=Chryseobacterium muglaense TaxID=2893752 RepID=A0A9Q3YUF5_9FLAO|nr:hypothetical protein [Chryseobacterium muglaense]MBD3905833.1 hypothetical protein [Chryseobacterium muglaense]MCC9035782.1 hypothetical protein [Chryseobacterium muglaense]MCM2555492.1 hypothetical protein [Chryseobacterium muglaense]
MEKLLKYLLVILGITGGICLIYFFAMTLMIGYAFGSFDKIYSTSELKEEYFSKEIEIKELVSYYNKIKPKNYSIDIEFKDDETLDRLQITTNKDSTYNVTYQGWDFRVADLQNDSLKNILNWEVDVVKELKVKLDKANCISVEDGEPIKIGFKRSGLGMYSFNIFQKTQTDRGEYNNKCEYILVNRNLMLEYGGGAIGPQCFPDKN